MYGVIYCITNLLNGMKYVGQTINLKRRIEHHKRENLYVDKAIKKYGFENFAVEVLDECENREQLNEREKFWILKFDCKKPRGYNLTDGGEGIIRYPHTNETKAKIALKHLGKKQTKEANAKNSEAHRGEKHPFFGKHRQAKTCAKISAKKRGETPYKNLRDLITKHQLSYASLAKKLGLKPSTISYKMLGKSNFTKKDIAKLVEIFCLPAEYLMERDESLPIVNMVEQYSLEHFSKIAIAEREETHFKNLLAEIDKHLFTYVSLAKLLNLSPTTISRKMRGQKNFTAKDIEKLVEIFGLSAEYLMKRAEE